MMTLRNAAQHAVDHRHAARVPAVKMVDAPKRTRCLPLGWILPYWMALCSLLLSGCFVLDPTLYMEREAEEDEMDFEEVDGGQDHESDDLMDGDLSPPNDIVAEDLCRLVDEWTNLNDIDDAYIDIQIDANSAAGEPIPAANLCVPLMAPTTRSLFLGFAGNPEQRLHFLFRSDIPNTTAFLSTMPNCETSGCVNRNRCFRGEQRLNYIFPNSTTASGQVLLNLAAVDQRAAPYRGSLEAWLVECMNGELEPGEACDDNNVNDEDECNNYCGYNLMPASRMTEREPNDDALLANRLNPPEGVRMIEIEGGFDAECDTDVYALRLDPAETPRIRVTMSPSSAGPCDERISSNVIFQPYLFNETTFTLMAFPSEATTIALSETPNVCVSGEIDLASLDSGTGEMEIRLLIAHRPENPTTPFIDDGSTYIINLEIAPDAVMP